jgi:hypothetical protein
MLAIFAFHSQGFLLIISGHEEGKTISRTRAGRNVLEISFLANR